MARQAVVVVHGIGDQSPMDTLSGYIKGICEEHDLVFSAPSHVSPHRDIRRVKVTWVPEISVTEDSSKPYSIGNTDFYELYWANLVTGSRLQHVTSWLSDLVRHPTRVAPRLLRFLRYNAGLASAVIAIGLLLFALGRQLSDTSLQVVGGLLATAVTGWIVRNLADVPRYLNNVADNVDIQRAIRREGVELLRKLHTLTYRTRGKRPTPVYDRIVVIGHSLGSVVAYDIVRDYWIEASDFYGTSPNSDTEALRAATEVEKQGEQLWLSDTPPHSGAHTSDPGFTDYQQAQRNLASRLPELVSSPPAPEDDASDQNAVRWAITDLVTLACPLTHADLLVANGADALIEAQWSRALPSCPPRRQTDRPTYRHTYRRGPRKGVESWHQAALFAFTRWTNVFYQPDIVGGPLQPLFGPGIADIELRRPRGFGRWFPAVHSQYNRDDLALSVLRRIVWDDGRRAKDRTVKELQRRSLDRVVLEIKDLEPTLWHGAIRSAPLLRKYEPSDRSSLLTLLNTLANVSSGEIAQVVDAALRDRPSLLDRMVIATDLLREEAPPSDEMLTDDSTELPETQELRPA